MQVKHSLDLDIIFTTGVTAAIIRSILFTLTVHGRLEYLALPTSFSFQTFVFGSRSLLRILGSLCFVFLIALLPSFRLVFVAALEDLAMASEAVGRTSG
jgi:hypothetical protein